jgi:hypothetical protein
MEVPAQAEKSGKKAEPLPFSVVCNLRYDEKTLDGDEERQAVLRTVRRYEQATATVKIGGQEHKPVLSPQRNILVAQFDGTKLLQFSPQGPLSIEELDLLNIPGNSLLLDGLLPGGPARAGDTCTPPKALLAALLGLEKLLESDVQSVLKEVTPEVARFELAGKAQGTVHDVLAQLEVKARYRFDRRLGRVDWLGLVTRESRPAGVVERGIEAAARLQVRITPQTTAPDLEPEALKDLVLEPDKYATRLIHESPEGQWRLLYDRRWHVISDQGRVATLRFLDEGQPLAQCIISLLPPRTEDKPMALEEFQREIRQALGKEFGSFVSAAESETAGEGGYRAYRVVVRGAGEASPLEWRYYLLADKSGRAAAMTFTLEANAAERLGHADRLLLEGFHFLSSPNN